MANIKLDESCSGKQVQVGANDSIEIELDEVPTTGYRWVISQINPEHFKVQSEDYTLYNSAGMGGGGVKRIQLERLGSGRGVVRLENKQPWSGDVYKTFEFTYE